MIATRNIGDDGLIRNVLLYNDQHVAHNESLQEEFFIFVLTVQKKDLLFIVLEIFFKL